MTVNSKTKALNGIKKAQLNRRQFTLEFKATVVRHKKAENLNFDQCGRKFDISGEQVQRWRALYDAGELTLGAGRKAVSPEQAELTRLRPELSRSKMEVSILKKAAAYFVRESL